MVATPDIVHLDLFRYTSEDFDLSLPVLNPDGTPYVFPAGTQAKCTLKRVNGAGAAETFDFSTAGGTIVISSNVIALKVDHATLDGVIGDYEGEVLVNISTGDVDMVPYVLHLSSEEGNTVNNSW